MAPRRDRRTKESRVLAAVPTDRWVDQRTVYRASKMDYYRCIEGLRTLVAMGLLLRARRTGSKGHFYRRRELREQAA